MKIDSKFTCFGCVVMIILGIYFCYYSVKNPYKFIEGLENSSYSCPNMLVQNGNEIYLYDSTKVKVPGVNPIKFNHLDEYIEFMEWQKSQNINCPVLYLQYSFDSQGNETYKLRPSILEPEGGLNPTSVATVENSGTCQQNSDNNNDDDDDDDDNDDVKSSKKLENDQYSANAMDSNWGGPEFTEQAIRDGKYSGDH